MAHLRGTAVKITRMTVEFPVFRTLADFARHYADRPLPDNIYRNKVGEIVLGEPPEQPEPVPFTTPAELERVYDLIEEVLPDGWSIDQRSECISVTWPTESTGDTFLRCQIMNVIIQEICDGQHKEILGDRDKLNALIERRIHVSKI